MEVFDLVVGVSTGAIIAALLAAKRLSVENCKDAYVNISKELFKQDRISGVSGLLLSHSYYNTEKWKKSLKKVRVLLFLKKKFISAFSSRDFRTIFFITNISYHS